MKTKFHKILLILLGVFLQSQGFAQTNEQPQFPFLHTEKNHLVYHDSTALTAFFNQLHALSQGKQNKVRIVQIGDSHLQGGWMDHRLRTRLQEQFPNGNGGRGLLFPYKLAHSNNPDQYKVEFEGTWTGCRNVFDQKPCAHAGIAGITASTEEKKASFSLKLDSTRALPYTFDKVVLFYPEESFQAYEVRVKAPGAKVLRQARDPQSGATVFWLTNSASECTVEVTRKGKGTFILQGMALENDAPGIVWSTIGVNGAKARSYLNGPDFFRQLEALDPDLVIVSLGTNDTYYSSFQDSVFREEYSALLGLVRVSAPKASLLLTTPGDAKRNGRYPVRNNVTAGRILEDLAKEHGAATWDLFEVMGGLGSVEEWHKSGLAGRDRIHFSKTGYELQGDLLLQAILEGFQAHEDAQEVPVEQPWWQEKLLSAFRFDEAKPMFFTSYLFWIFFTVFLGIYALIYKRMRLRNLYLLLISLFFYFKAGGLFFGLLLFSTVVDYLIGHAIHRSEKQIHKKLWLAGSVIVNLGLLSFFKYAAFFAESINSMLGTDFQAINIFASLSNSFFGTGFEVDSILLPVGISFFTFQTISYSVDVFRGRIKPVKNIIDFAFFVSFFPQLVAGPIVRASEFIPQVSKPYSVTRKDFTRALYLILTGLIKKMVISDFIAVNFVQRVFETPLNYSGFENLMGVYGYALQIYCDFSGYSDIAIGLALLLGFTLPLNFNAPYLASDITDFWRRWHISLSSWLKDYLYIPLGGNRGGSIVTWLMLPVMAGFLAALLPSPWNLISGSLLGLGIAILGWMAWKNPEFRRKLASRINLLITMFLGGLWHGAAVRFLLWGLLHGGALAAHKVWSQKVSGKWFAGRKMPFWYRGLTLLVTFHFVAFCWILFRAENMEIFTQMLGQMVNHFHPELILEWAVSYKWVLALMLLGFVAHALPRHIKGFAERGLEKLPTFAWSLLIVVVVVVLYQFRAADLQPFIYFQF